MEYLPEKHGESTEWESFVQAARKPVLLSFNAGDRGRAIEVPTDGQTVAGALNTLRVPFSENTPSPEDFQITRWGSDPFVFGSCSFNPAGSHPQKPRELAHPLRDRLYFAGEATEQNDIGTAHGVYLSGIRAADEILG